MTQLTMLNELPVNEGVKKYTLQSEINITFGCTVFG